MEGLCQSILKWHQYFDLTYPWEYGDEDRVTHITAEDVIKSIRNLKLGRGYDQPRQKAISTAIKHLTDQRKQYEADALEAKDDDKRQWLVGHYMEYVHKLYNVVAHLKSLKKKGFKYVTEIGFGDNHGEVQGVGVGDIMDYAGRHIDMEKEDLAVWTEQNR
jgi:hypothetical protein